MRLTRYLLFAWFPALLWMGIVFLVSSDSNPYRLIPNAHQAPGMAAPVSSTSITPAPTPLANPNRDPATTPLPVQNPKNELPTTPLRPQYEAVGRLAHVIEFALLSFLCVRALKIDPKDSTPGIRRQWDDILLGRAVGLQGGQNSGKALWIPLISFAIAFAFGLSDEIHQSSVAGRTFQFVDLLLDGLGALLGVLLFIKIERNRAANMRPARG